MAVAAIQQRAPPRRLRGVKPESERERKNTNAGAPITNPIGSGFVVHGGGMDLETTLAQTTRK
jgi:hypothetical protein